MTFYEVINVIRADKSFSRVVIDRSDSYYLHLRCQTISIISAEEES